MAYQVLARKWRPQDFESVVGQGPVVQALRNALADGRIAHSYLFSGIRGIGKTSVARVLAKALNCQTGPPSDPCNECEACKGITAGSDLDVLEIDAATYSKVEQVRELTDSLQYGPARNAYKVVIIDEIHRLSRQAFDALLKIVEEPPPHLVFIFATTESEAVPATILSRCQSFQFRRVPLAEMVEHLERVSSAEELEVSDHALHLIARASEGSVRDAIALLDQLATYGGGRIADDEVGRILGGVDLALFLDLIRAIAAGDRDHVSGFVHEVEELGWDPRHVYGEFLSYCRDALHLALDPQNARVDLPVEEASALAATAKDAGYENLLRLLNLLLESEMTVRRSGSAGLALEIALLRAGELPKLTAIEDILSSAQGGSSSTKGRGPDVEKPVGETSSSARKQSMPRSESSVAAVAPPELESSEAGPSAPPETYTAPESSEPAPQAVAAPPQNGDETLFQPPPSREAESREAESPDVGPPATGPPATGPPQTGPPEAGPPQTEPPEAGPSQTEPPEAESPPVSPPRIGEGRELVTQLLERISYLKQPLAAHLGSAQSLSVSDGVLTISAVPGDVVLEKTLLRPSNKKLLEQTLGEMLGPSADWKVRAGRKAVGASDGPSGDDSAPPAVTDDPTVQAVLDLFGGHIETIEPRGESPGPESTGPVSIGKEEASR